MEVFAHRGLHTLDVHENTMDAFALAATHGLGIETDLRSTSDDAVVLFHDRCVWGVPVSEMTHSELEATLSRPVPTLDQLLDAKLAVPINLDVKTPEALRLALPAMLRARSAIAFVSAFRHDLAIAAAEAGLPSAYLMASAPASGEPLPSVRTNLATVVMDYDVIDRSMMDRASSAGLRVASYGSIARSEHDRLRTLGVVAAITDRPHSVATIDHIA